MIGLDELPMNDYGKQHTQYPMVTGTSVIGMIYDGGVMISADTLASYGSMARFRSVDRIFRVNDSTIVAASGDIADIDHLKHLIEQKVMEEDCLDDGHQMKPRALFSWCTRLLYQRRSKFNPLWVTLLIGGMQDDKPFLGYVDKIGMAHECPHIATGMGSYLGLPLMRNLSDMYDQNHLPSENEAKKCLEQCMKVLYYRDCRAHKSYITGNVNLKNKSTISKPADIEGNWKLADMIHGYE
ncbi:hypothetical protein SNEBB_001427 [Seison nebaliae]|nr:hypothetical protein SNEBB_001427 [Seison nebaliae]